MQRDRARSPATQTARARRPTTLDKKTFSKILPHRIGRAVERSSFYNPCTCDRSPRPVRCYGCPDARLSLSSEHIPVRGKSRPSKLLSIGVSTDPTGDKSRRDTRPIRSGWISSATTNSWPANSPNPSARTMLGCSPNRTQVSASVRKLARTEGSYCRLGAFRMQAPPSRWFTHRQCRGRRLPLPW